MRSPRLLCLAAACALACGDTSSGVLHLSEVSPNRVPFGSPERLLLHGTFAPELVVELGSQAPPTLENGFEVHFGPERSYAVHLHSREALEATVPPTLAPGLHDVSVLDARGHSATLPAALEVIDRSAHRLVFVTSMRSAHPDTWTEPLRVELRDASGQTVPTFLERRVQVTSDSPTGRFGSPGSDEASASLDVVLTPGQSGVDFRYRDSLSGYHTLQASTLEFPVISQTVAVGRLGPPAAVRFTRVPTAPLVAGELVALALEVQDVSGGPASFPATGIRLELGSSSPAGGLSLADGDPPTPSLSLILHAQQGRLPFFYRDTRSAAEVWLRASATNLDTGASLTPGEVSLAVTPGPSRRFEVERLGTAPIQVGEPVPFLLRALDAYGNPTPFSGPVLLSTFPEQDPGLTPLRAELSSGTALVDVRFSRVQTTALVATDPATSSVRGASPELFVHPGPPVQLTASPVDSQQRAGIPFSLTLEALDRFGNRTDVPLSVAIAASGIPADALSPTTSGTFTGSTTLSLTLTAAVANTTLAFSDGRLTTTSRSFSVLPGPTQRFLLDDIPSPQQAGVPFRVHIRAVDAYGNLTEDVHALELGAEGVHNHLFTPLLVPGFRGEADVDVTVKQAHTGTRVQARSGTAQGQQAGTFAVLPGDFVGYRVEAPDCVTLRDRWRLTLTAVDTWSNTVTSYAGQASLTLAPEGQVIPGTTRAFSRGTQTEPAANLSGLPDGSTYSCLELTATDSTDPGKIGRKCLQLRESCPR
jgi:hypothetical protein